MRRFGIVLILLLAATALFAQSPTTWKVDPVHSYVGFSVRHMMVSNVRGNFDSFSGSIVGDPKDPANARVEVTIDATSLDTRNANRDEHLKSADFFDVTRFPTITFQSKKVEKAGDGQLRVTGDLTMHGVTKEVVLDVEGPSPPVQAGPRTRVGLTATTKLNRKDFGLNWNRVMEAGGVTVGDDVRINIELELIKQEAEAPKPPTS